MLMIADLQRHAASEASDALVLPERGLMIREPWVSQVLMKRKLWELRGISTRIGAG